MAVRCGVALKASARQCGSSCQLLSTGLKVGSFCGKVAASGVWAELEGSGPYWWQEWAVLVAACHASHPIQVLILSPAFLKYIHENWTERHGRYPSTGFTALLFALHACQQVSTAGSTTHCSAPWAPSGACHHCST